MTEWFSAIATAHAVLPPASMLPTGVALSWGVCIAALCVAALCVFAARTGRWPHLRYLAVAVLLSACLPWTRGWTAYLALAFQTPSLFTCVWCVVWIVLGVTRPLAQNLTHHAAERLTPTTVQFASQRQPVEVPWLALAGVLLGWALWLDTFNRWPVFVGIDVPLYDWGFGAPALMTVALLMWAGAAWTWRQTGALTRGQQVVVVALLGFAVTRWPTGNLWDALLDPWLWAACHIQGFKAGWTAWRTSKYSRQNSKFSGV